ncbi:MAG: 16S rRNA (cytidine(1402)-2'-O)-methyltransferase [Patescibacteria group bacterium]
MLSIVATPIGNLKDITLRAIETLKSCDAIVCEDTRVTGNLIKQLGLEKKELISMHGYSDPKKIETILDRLKRGGHLALTSDAGTPGISDPGFALVARVQEWNKNFKPVVQERSCTTGFIPMEVIPGPSAVLAALSGSGLPVHQFLYLGFLPLKKGRKSLIESFVKKERTIVFYESVHRIERTLLELNVALKEQPDRPVVIARELTKMHEEFVRTTAGQLKEIAKNITKKGEFVVIIGAQRGSESRS